LTCFIKGNASTPSGEQESFWSHRGHNIYGVRLGFSVPLPSRDEFIHKTQHYVQTDHTQFKLYGITFFAYNGSPDKVSVFLASPQGLAAI
jgi:hypothetical protein